MSRYTSIWSTFWDEEKYICLPSDQLRLMYLFLLTNHASNLIGYYRVSISYFTSVFQISNEYAVECLKLLETAKLIRFNEKKSLVLLIDYMRYTPVVSETQLKGLSKELNLIDRNDLDVTFVSEVCRHLKNPEHVMEHYIPSNMYESVKGYDSS